VENHIQESCLRESGEELEEGGIIGIRVFEDSSLALRILSEWLPAYQQVYARAALENGGVGLVLEYNGLPVGSAIGYPAGSRGGRVALGVIYYVYVRPRSRGRGLGKVLVASLEELLSDMGASLYVASTREDNWSSQRMFESLGYKVFKWWELEEEVGSEALEALEAAACMYEDEIVMIKPYDRRVISKLRRSDYEELWYKTCYKPWLDMRRHGRTAWAP